MRLLFADLVVLRSENIDLFYLQLWEFVQCVKPQDFVEWVWVRDVAVLNWEIRRWQRFKVFFVGFGHEDIERHLKEVGTLPCEIQKLINTPSASAFVFLVDKHKFDLYRAADMLIASAENRRDRLLHQIELRREQFAERMRKASIDMIRGGPDQEAIAAE
jgi:hypothetical protein